MYGVTQIQATAVYQSITDNVQRTIIVNKTNRNAINHGVTVSRNTSFDDWVKTFHPIERVKNIVKELLNT